MTDWPFSDPPNVAVLTTRRIVRDAAWIARVVHDAEDGGWQFHDGTPGARHESEAVVTSLRDLVLRDASLRALADLPEGWCAWRGSPEQPWQRARVDGV